MKISKIILLILLIVFMGIQFITQKREVLDWINKIDDSISLQN
jgi:hypothetical protein